MGVPDQSDQVITFDVLATKVARCQDCSRHFQTDFRVSAFFCSVSRFLGGLFTEVVSRLREPSSTLPLVVAGEALMGAPLLIGLCTDIAAILVCVLQLALIPVGDDATEVRLLLAAVGFALALLGPGAWSLDARLFGRRRVEIKNLGDN
jgi:uncharacterized membrane protein YphA (DoxX/SURF4 family)